MLFSILQFVAAFWAFFYLLQFIFYPYNYIIALITKSYKKVRNQDRFSNKIYKILMSRGEI